MGQVVPVFEIAEMPTTGIDLGSLAEQLRASGDEVPSEGLVVETLRVAGIAIREFDLQPPDLEDVFIALIGFGALCYTGFGDVFSGLGISQNPDVDFPVVTVSVTLEGAAPEVMETDVADVIEDAVMLAAAAWIAKFAWSGLSLPILIVSFESW